jgi:hypothetical protein
MCNCEDFPCCGHDGWGVATVDLWDIEVEMGPYVCPICLESDEWGPTCDCL